MVTSLRRFIIIFLVLMSQASCVLHSLSQGQSQPARPLEGYVTLDKLPFREAWYGTYFKEDKIGYSHFKIEPSGPDFVIKSDSLMRLTAMKKTDEVTMSESVRVRPDLTMISFDSAVRMNGKNLKMTGSRQGDRFVVDIEVDGEKVSREYPIDAQVYHSSAKTLLPALRGLKDGTTYSFRVFNAEKQGIEKVDQLVSLVRGDPGPNGEVWKVRNTTGRSHVDSWLNAKGLTVLERALDGDLVVILEDKSTVDRFLTQKTAGKDIILDLSLIRVDKPIRSPETTKFMKVRMKGIDSALIAQDHRQEVAPAVAGKPEEGFFVTVRAEGVPQSEGTTDRERSRAAASDLGEYLASTYAIKADHPEIVSQAEKIVSPKDRDMDKVAKLVIWTAENIANRMKDAFTALEVLRRKEGQCRGHTALYTALARSRKIPTRQVTGIVYTDQGGFLYHAWAESYVNNKWLAVDPTFKQIPADATHIKIASDEPEDAASSVLKMVGKVKLDVLEYR